QRRPQRYEPARDGEPEGRRLLGAGYNARSLNGPSVARLRLANISKTYRRANAPVLALREITLDVPEGELLAIVGPSGCGKTTLLRIVAGLERPDSGGRVLFNGNDVIDVPIERRNVGMVFQS